MRAMRACVIAVSAALTCVACGGGGNNGGSSSTTTPPPPVPQLAITTAAILPATVEGRPYSTALAAANGQGSLHWSIAPSAGLFVNGLAIDANTGVLAGTPTFFGTGGFTATVSDSASPVHTVTKSFTVTAFPQLSSGQNQIATMREFNSPVFVHAGIQGGLPPISYSVASGSIPAGLRFDSTGQLVGGANQTGTFQFMLAAQDSFSPPEIASQPFTIVVQPPGLSLPNSLPTRIASGEPFNKTLVVLGGTPPFSFVLSGQKPPELTFDSKAGILNGMPLTPGTYSFSVTVSDSDSPKQFASQFFNITVGPALGRNDTAMTAIAVQNGGYQASISPYIDPPHAAPLPADNDYYKFASMGGSIVHVETNAKRLLQQNPLDTVIEITDGNTRLNTCRQPGDTSTTFTGNCINDDISQTPHIQDSALDVRVPGPTNQATVVYIHVFDWRGDARPDMTYSLQVSGIVSPMQVATTSLAGAAVGIPYSMQLMASGASGAVTWSTDPSALPPGLNLSANGLLSGTATTAAAYPITIHAADSASPPQQVTKDFSLLVEIPPSVTTTSFPDGLTGVPYGPIPLAFTGGTGPFLYTFSGGQNTFSGGQNLDIGIDQTGAMHGVQDIPGTFRFTAGVTDALGFNSGGQFMIVFHPGTLNAPNVNGTAQINAFSTIFLVPTGGTPSFTCSVSSGSFPPGMKFVLSATGCAVQGVPTASGVFTAGYNVVDSGQPQQTATGTITINVSP